MFYWEINSTDSVSVLYYRSDARYVNNLSNNQTKKPPLLRAMKSFCKLQYNVLCEMLPLNSEIQCVLQFSEVIFICPPLPFVSSGFRFRQR